MGVGSTSVTLAVPVHSTVMISSERSAGSGSASVRSVLGFGVPGDSVTTTGLVNTMKVARMCVGAEVGTEVGAEVGTAVGAVDGAMVGAVVGAFDGTFVGAVVGSDDGAVEGAAEGSAVGLCDGAAVGYDVGASVGATVQSGHPTPEQVKPSVPSQPQYETSHTAEVKPHVPGRPAAMSQSSF